jgi:hypothetical protein
MVKVLICPENFLKCKLCSACKLERLGDKGKEGLGFMAPPLPRLRAVRLLRLRSRTAKLRRAAPLTRSVPHRGGDRL